MIELLYIVLLIFGVLQILLFFKMWKMANNVKEMRDRIIAGQQIKYYLTIGDKEKAYKKAVDELYNDLSTQIVTTYGEAFVYKTRSTIEMYRKIIEETGYPMPENLSDPQKFWDIWHKKWE